LGKKKKRGFRGGPHPWGMGWGGKQQTHWGAGGSKTMVSRSRGLFSGSGIPPRLGGGGGTGGGKPPRFVSTPPRVFWGKWGVAFGREKKKIKKTKKNKIFSFLWGKQKKKKNLGLGGELTQQVVEIPKKKQNVLSRWGSAKCFDCWGEPGGGGGRFFFPGGGNIPATPNFFLFFWGGGQTQECRPVGSLGGGNTKT